MLLPFVFYAVDMSKLFLLLAAFVLVAIEPSQSRAYPPVEMQACLANALNAVTAKGLNTTYPKVKQYCDCSLTKIVDQGKDINSSIAYCNAKYIR